MKDETRAVIRGYRFAFDLFRADPSSRYVVRRDNTHYFFGVDHPLYNGAYATRLGRDASRRVDEVLDVFRRAGVSATWHVDPGTRPRGLGRLLRLKGLSDGGSTPGMTLVLRRRRRLPDAGDVTVREACGGAALARWNDVYCRVFGFDERLRDGVRDSYRAILARRPGAMKLYVASRRGRAAGCAMLTLDGRLAGLWAIGVLDGVRRRGLGLALTQRCLDDAERAGCRLAMLGASEQGYGLYRKLGFRAACRMRQYVYSPPRTPAAR
ncbi:MAG: GNAT family N-acetyltransferase [Elusimicrobia bacterium]|nr:GNAT family N-acetyltransferase [Elusimicrobiota bacterium]